MIEWDVDKNIDDYLETIHHVDEQYKHIISMVKKYAKYGLGVSLITAMAIFGLGIENKKNYFDLDERIQNNETLVEEVQRNGFVIGDACYKTIKKNYYEVVPCLTKKIEQ